jgi:ubiquinone/menaquinone biosynthesis C-methylase UbiE
VFNRAPTESDRCSRRCSAAGARLMTGQEVFRSVRVRNSGNAMLRASEPGAARIETRWTTAEGAPLPTLVVSNELPVDIEPGREITLILRVRAPAEAGRFTLNVVLLVPGEPAATVAAIPVETISCELPVFEYSYFPDLLEYGPDHHVAMLETLEFLKQQYPAKSTAVLEIGGGVHPTGHAIAAHGHRAHGHRVVSSDISHSQSILGTLFFQHKMPALAESLAFISCDGTELPFGDEAFDGVMLFAAFHHFADPLALLAEMKRVIRPDGFIFLGCENCAPNPADPQYREELRRGINEQMWTLAEFTDFFRKAGLRVVRARVDRHSLKVGLVRA